MKLIRGKWWTMLALKDDPTVWNFQTEKRFMYYLWLFCDKKSYFGYLSICLKNENIWNLKVVERICQVQRSISSLNSQSIEFYFFDFRDIWNSSNRWESILLHYICVQSYILLSERVINCSFFFVIAFTVMITQHASINFLHWSRKWSVIFNPKREQ